MGGGRCYLEALSKTIGIFALSSEESELGALVRACTEGLGMQSRLRDFNVDVGIDIVLSSHDSKGLSFVGTV